MSPKKINPRKTILPVYRIKTIMKTTPDVHNINGEAYYLMTKATELFIALLAKESFKRSDEDELNYKCLSDTVETKSTYEFLRDLIPQKITVKKYKEIMEEKAQAGLENADHYL